MQQLELFGTNELKPVRAYLHVWTEAERMHRLAEIKKPAPELRADRSGRKQTSGGRGLPARVRDA